MYLKMAAFSCIQGNKEMHDYKDNITFKGTGKCECDLMNIPDSCITRIIHLGH